MKRTLLAAALATMLAVPQATAQTGVTPAGAEAVGAFKALPEIHPGAVPASGMPNVGALFAVLGQRVLFSANSINDESTTSSLWRSDGSEAGTQLVKDVALGAVSGIGTSSIVLNNLLIFDASTPAIGTELWRSDGTPDGTFLLKDLNPGGNGSFPRNYRLAGDRVFFHAELDRERIALWVTDGTRDGTLLLRSFAEIRETLALTNGSLLFSAAEQDGDLELWRSDGTAEGTARVADLRPGARGSRPEDLIELATDHVLFAASVDGDRELWMTDGTRDGTRLLKNLAENQSSEPRMLARLDLALDDSGPVQRRALFAATNSAGKASLWISNGLPDTVIPPNVIVRNTKEILALPNGIDSFKPRVIGVRRILNQEGGYYDLALLSLDDVTGNGPLWASDGSAAGTVQISRANKYGLWESSVARMGESFYFPAQTQEMGAELWKSDGTPDGTVLVADTNPSVRDSFPSDITLLGDEIVFIADDGAHGRELHVTTGAGAVLVKDVMPGAGSGALEILGAANGVLYFVGRDQTTGIELWKTDGTEAGTRRVKNIGPDVAGLIVPQNVAAYPTFAAMGSRLLLGALDLLPSAPDRVPGTGSIWSSDGVTVSVLRRFQDTIEIDPPINVVALGSGTSAQTLFTARTEPNVTDLWRSDGSISGTARLIDLIRPSYGNVDGITRVGERAIFNVFTSTADGKSSFHSLWSSDGTVQGTRMISGNIGIDVINRAVSGGALYFDDGNDGLVKTDGTAAGTQLITRTAYGVSGLTAGPAGGVFFVNKTEQGDQLWKSNGTRAGTVFVHDVFSTTRTGEYGQILYVNGALYFAADDGVHGYELWISDGTTAGTRLLRDLYPGPGTSLPWHLTAYKGALYFVATGADGKQTLWKSDGTSAGTQPLRTDEGAPQSPGDLTVASGQLFFTASDPVHGRELWRSDGSAAGTVIHQDIVPGPANSWSRVLAATDQHVFAVAHTDQRGMELWAASYGEGQPPPPPPGSRTVHLPAVLRAR